MLQENIAFKQNDDQQAFSQKKQNQNQLYSLNEIVNENHEFKNQENIYKIVNKNKNQKKKEKHEVTEKTGRIQKYKYV